MTSSSLMKHVVFFTICCVSSITLVHSSTFLVKWYFYDSWCCAVSFMQSLCIMVMIYTLHYSFLARGKHLHCIRCRVHVAAQMRRRKNAYRTKNSVLLQRHLAELKRKAGDNEQIPCSIYSFLNGTCKPQWGQTSWGKVQFFKPLFRSILPQFNARHCLDWFSPAWRVALLWE